MNNQVHLKDAWDTWERALVKVEEAKSLYFRIAGASKIRLCLSCNKPMPTWDHSQTCDGCDLPWGWDSAQGRRDRRAAELDSEIERLRAERSKL